jgi:hypothetical protein
VEEWSEHVADPAIVAEVSAAEECDDGVEDDELAIAVRLECVTERAKVAEAEEDFGKDGDSGLVENGVEDVDFFEVSAEGGDARADDFVGIIFARAEEDGSLGAGGTARAEGIIRERSSGGDASGDVEGEEGFSDARV